jgi:hypothetical protein
MIRVRGPVLGGRDRSAAQRGTCPRARQPVSWFMRWRAVQPASCPGRAAHRPSGFLAHPLADSGCPAACPLTRSTVKDIDPAGQATCWGTEAGKGTMNLGRELHFDKRNTNALRWVRVISHDDQKTALETSVRDMGQPGRAGNGALNGRRRSGLSPSNLKVSSPIVRGFPVTDLFEFGVVQGRAIDEVRRCHTGPATQLLGALERPPPKTSMDRLKHTQDFRCALIGSLAIGAWQGHKSVRTLSKASCISTAVEKRSGLAGAHAFMRKCASSALRSGRKVLGSITGS